MAMSALRMASSLGLRAMPARARVATQSSRSMVVRAAVSAPQPVVVKREDVITSDPHNNVTDHIFEKIGYNLHKRPDHPLGIIKAVIGDYFDEKFGKGEFATFDDMYPIVTAHANFDSVLVPPDHVSRSANDTYYVNKDNVLRCHTSAHQAEMLKDGARKFLVTGDVYRRDEIDASHFPAFHQMEGVKLFDPAAVGGEMDREEWLASEGCQLVAADLKKSEAATRADRKSVV